MSTPHKHAELIKAWADGSSIELQDINGDWFITFHPNWRRDGPYRVYKEPKPDIIHYARSGNLVSTVRREFDDIKLTINGETGDLKSVEVIS